MLNTKQLASIELLVHHESRCSIFPVFCMKLLEEILIYSRMNSGIIDSDVITCYLMGSFSCIRPQES
jgi:hypothetical protein